MSPSRRPCVPRLATHRLLNIRAGSQARCKQAVDARRARYDTSEIQLGPP